MGATTTRLANRYPLLSDTADVPRDIQNLATDLDKAAIFGVGTLASRPPSASGTPGISGRFFYANDAGAGAGDLWFDFGTGYRKVALQATDLSLSGMTAVTTQQLIVANPANATTYAISVTPSYAVNGSRVLTYNIPGDAGPRFAVDYQGSIYWGTGASAGGDFSLGRFSSTVLAATYNLWAGVGVSPGAAGVAAAASGDSWPRAALYNNSQLVFGPGTAGTDARIFRAGSGWIQTDSRFGAWLGSAGATAVEAGVAGGAQPAWYVTSSGNHGWSDRTNAADTFLYRNGVNRLQLDGYFSINRPSLTSDGLSFIINNGANASYYIRADGYTMWGSGSAAADLFMYRSAAQSMQIVGSLNVTLNGSFQDIYGRNVGLSGYLAVTGASAGTLGIAMSVSGDANARAYWSVDGRLNWGPGNTGVDTSLYRLGVNHLHTSSTFSDDVDIYARWGGASQVAMGNGGPSGQAGFNFGSPADTYLYRYQANMLATQVWFWAGWGASPGNGGVAAVASGDGWPRVAMYNNGQLVFGPGTAGVDCNLYRNGAGALKTDGTLQVVGNLYANGTIYVGSTANDANLSRASANRISTIGSFQSQGAATGWGFEVLATGKSYVSAMLRSDGIFFGSGDTSYDTWMTRAASGQLQTNGSLVAQQTVQQQGGGPGAPYSGLLINLPGIGQRWVATLGADSSGVGGWRMMVVLN